MPCTALRFLLYRALENERARRPPRPLAGGDLSSLDGECWCPRRLPQHIDNFRKEMPLQAAPQRPR